MAAPVLDTGTITTSIADGTSIDITMPSTVNADDVLIIIVGDDADNTGGASLFQTPSGWTSLLANGSNTSDAWIHAFYKVAVGDEDGTTVTVQHSSTTDELYGWGMRVTGANSSAPVHVTGSSTPAVGTSHTIPEITTVTPDCLIFYAGAFDGADGFPFSVSGTGSFTERGELESPTSGGGNDAAGSWGTKTMSGSGGTGTAIITASVSDGHAGIMFSIQPANPVDIAPPKGALTLTGNAPTVDVTKHISIAGVSNQLTLSSSAPTLDVENNVTISLPTNSSLSLGNWTGLTLDVTNFPDIDIEIPPASQTLTDAAGEFTDPSLWTLESANMAIIEDGILLFDGVDGDSAILPNAAASYHKPITQLREYVIEYEITDYVAGLFDVLMGGTFTQAKAANGVYAERVFATSANALEIRAQFNAKARIPYVKVTELNVSGRPPSIQIGVVKTIPSASQHLEDPEFDDGSKWADNADFNVHDGVIEGYGVNSSNAVFGDYYHQPAAGQVFRVEYEISSYTQGGFYVAVGGQGTTPRTEAGTWVDYITAVSSGAPLVVSINNFIGVVEYCRITEVNLGGKALTVDISTSAIDIPIPQGELTLTGNAPTIDLTDHINIGVPQGALTLTGYVTEPSLTNDVDIQLIVNNLTLTGAAPTLDVTAHVPIALIANNLTITGETPVVDVTADVPIAVPQGELTLTGNAPTVDVSADRNIAVPSGSLTITGNAPTIDVTVHIPLDMVVGNLSLTGNAPTLDVTLDIPIEIPLGSLTITGNEPTLDVGANIDIVVPAGNITLTGFAPTIDLTGHVIKELPKAELTLTGYNPNLSIGDNVDIGLPSGSLTITGNAPEIVLTGHVILAVPKAEITLSTNTPEIIVTNHVPVYPLVGELTITGSTPTIEVSADRSVTIPQGSLTIAANDPVVDLTGHVVKPIPKAELTLVSSNPTVDVPSATPEAPGRGRGASGGGTGRKYKKALREENVKQSKKKAGKPRVGRLEDVVLPAPKYEAEVQEALNEVVAEVIQQDKSEYKESGLSLKQITSAIVNTTKALEQERFKALVEETQTIVAGIRQQSEQKEEAAKREELAIQRARAQAEEIAREELRAAIEAEKVALLKRKQEEEDLIAILYILDDVA